MKTANGIIIGHADHGLKDEHFALIDTLLEGWEGNFQILCVEMPEGVSDLQCGLYGPAVGDDAIGEDAVTYEKRGNRPGPSRLIDRPHRPCRRMVVIAGPGRDESIVYTAYGTNALAPSPREWWDSSMKPAEAIEAATFWRDHALAK